MFCLGSMRLSYLRPVIRKKLQSSEANTSFGVTWSKRGCLPDLIANTSVNFVVRGHSTPVSGAAHARPENNDSTSGRQ